MDWCLLLCTCSCYCWFLQKYKAVHTRAKSQAKTECTVSVATQGGYSTVWISHLCRKRWAYLAVNRWWKGSTFPHVVVCLRLAFYSYLRSSTLKTNIHSLTRCRARQSIFHGMHGSRNVFRCEIRNFPQRILTELDQCQLGYSHPPYTPFLLLKPTLTCRVSV